MAAMGGADVASRREITGAGGNVSGSDTGLA